MYICLLKSTFRMKDTPQSSQENGWKPLCFRQCVIRFDDWLNDFPQKLHWWGFSPVWMYVCFFISDFWWNFLPQKWHSNGRVSEWINMWVDNVEERLKLFPQTLHWNGFLFECTIICCFKLMELLNTLSHTWQLYNCLVTDPGIFTLPSFAISFDSAPLAFNKWPFSFWSSSSFWSFNLYFGPPWDIGAW